MLEKLLKRKNFNKGSWVLKQGFPEWVFGCSNCGYLIDFAFQTNPRREGYLHCLYCGKPKNKEIYDPKDVW